MNTDLNLIRYILTQNLLVLKWVGARFVHWNGGTLTADASCHITPVGQALASATMYF